MERYNCCIIEGGLKPGRFGLLAARKNNNWHIVGFETPKAGLDYFEEGYKRAHLRSYEGSMSACINYIFFRPSIVELSLEAAKALIVGEHIESWYSIAGGVEVFPLRTEPARLLWAVGRKPDLIKPEWLA